MDFSILCNKRARLDVIHHNVEDMIEKLIKINRTKILY